MAGKIQKVKGKAKEAAGDLTGNKSLKREGKADKAAGTTKNKADKAAGKTKNKADKAAGKTKRAVGKAADKVKGKR